MSEVATQIVAGIFLILVLFWLFNPKSQAPKVIGSLAKGVIGETQALQGFSPTGGQFYGGGQTV
jgi:hypothetical protein